MRTLTEIVNDLIELNAAQEAEINKLKEQVTALSPSTDSTTAPPAVVEETVPDFGAPSGIELTGNNTEDTRLEWRPAVDASGSGLAPGYIVFWNGPINGSITVTEPRVDLEDTTGWPKGVYQFTVTADKGGSASINAEW